MNDHKPSPRTLILVLASFFVVVLPAICFTAMGYMWFVEHVLKLDCNTKPESIVDQLLVLAAVFPMILLMPVAIMIAGVPWMFAMSRVLSWSDIEYFTKQKGPRLPLLSDWLDRLWLHMIQSRRLASPPGEPQ
jgi:hypothetical protein